MKRRLIAAVTGILLALVGAVMVLSYAAGADQRALAGTKTTPVLVATKLIPQGTPSERLVGLVTVKELPALAVTSGAVGSLTELAGRVAADDVHPGEQVLSARFADPTSLAATQSVKVPAGMQQVAVSLDSQRVMGGRLKAGDTVGVFLSASKKTHLALHKVLVSDVQGGVAAPAAEGSGSAAAPAGTVMVTLVLNAANAERVVWAAEFGTIWLSLEPAAAPQTGTGIVTEGNALR
jgi:pilus assembly protein CpaB